MEVFLSLLTWYYHINIVKPKPGLVVVPKSFLQAVVLIWLFKVHLQSLIEISELETLFRRHVLHHRGGLRVRLLEYWTVDLDLVVGEERPRGDHGVDQVFPLRGGCTGGGGGERRTLWGTKGPCKVQSENKYLNRNFSTLLQYIYFLGGFFPEPNGNTGISPLCQTLDGVSPFSFFSRGVGVTSFSSSTSLSSSNSSSSLGT